MEATEREQLSEKNKVKGGTGEASSWKEEFLGVIEEGRKSGHITVDYGGYGGGKGAIKIKFKDDDDGDDEDEEEEEEPPSGSEEEEDEDEGWEQVYGERETEDSVRFETYGGGPSGGYEVSKTTRGEDGLFYLWSWHQNWGTERQLTHLPNARLLFKEERHGSASIKYLKVVYPGLSGGGIFIELTIIFCRNYF